MSVPPDYFNNLLSDPEMGMAAGILSGSGPKPFPTSFGQVLGEGMLSGQQYSGTALDQQMKRLMLGRQLAVMRYIAAHQGNGAGAPQSPLAPGGAPPLGGTPMTPPPAGTSPLAPPGAAPGPLSGAAPVSAPTSAQSAAPDAGEDDSGGFAPQDLVNLSLLSGDFGGAANTEMAMMKDKWHVAQDAEMKNLHLSSLPDGMSWLVNGMGDAKPVGQDTIRTFSTIDNNGQRVDRLGRVVNIGGKDRVIPLTGEYGVDPNTPQPGAQDPAASLSPADKSLVDAVANYQLEVPRNVTTNPVRYQNFMGAVMAKNPGFREGNFEAANRQWVDFTSGASGKTLRAIDNLNQSVELLKPLAANLGNVGAPAWNAAADAYKRETGEAAPANFDQMLSLVNGQIDALVKNGAASPEAGEKAKAIIAANSSPEQIAGALGQVQQVLKIQLAGLKNSYESVGLRNFENNLKLSPQTLHLLTGEGDKTWIYKDGQLVPAGGS